jgi:uncharacterized protein (TIGR02246 family)
MALTSVLYGQAPTFNQKYGTQEDEWRIKYLNVQYVQSWVKADSAMYNRRLWANDWIQQNSYDGRLYSKAEMLPKFGTPRFDKIEYFYADNVTVQFITNDVALVFALTPYRMRDGASGLSQYNDVYVKRDGQWVCVSANITAYPSPGDTRSFVSLPPMPPIISAVDGTPTDKKLLIELNNKHAEGFGNSRGELLEDILSEDFILLNSDGRLYRKREIIDAVKSRAATKVVQSYKIENVAIRFVAPDVALIHAAMVTELANGKKAATQYNDIYVKRDNKWVCVSGNNTPVKG